MKHNNILISAFLLLYTIAGQTSDMPKEYIHKPFAEQIKRYREAIGDNKDELHLHKEGLFNILKDAFAIVYWGINNWPEKRKKPLKPDVMQYLYSTEDYEKNKDKYVDKLSSLWQFASNIIQQKKLCPHLLSNFMYLLTRLASNFQAQRDPSDGIPDFSNMLDYAIDQTCNKDLNDHIISIPIFGNTEKESQGIAPRRFVEEYVKDIPANLAFFNILSVDLEAYEYLKERKLRRSKKEPHFSNFVSPYELYDHDLQHTELQNMAQKYFFEHAKFNWHAFMQWLNKIRLGITNENDQQLFTNGMFLLIHELVVYRSIYDNIAKLLNDPKDYINKIPSIVNLINKYIISQLSSEIGVVDYKIYYRDLEKMLYKSVLTKESLKDKDGKALLIMPPKEGRTPEQRKDAVTNAYNSFWQRFLELIVP